MIDPAFDLFEDPRMPLALFVVGLVLVLAAAIARGRTTILATIFAGVAALFAGLMYAKETTLLLLWELRAILADESSTALLGAVAVVSGWIGAQIAIRSLDRAAMDTAANAFLDLRARYHSQEMAAAITVLAGFAIPVKDTCAGLWRKKLDADEFQAIGAILDAQRKLLSPSQRDELKSAVRRVCGYFDDVAFLFRHKILTIETTRSFLNVGGLNVYYETCIPLHVVDNPTAPSIENARLLRAIMRRQGSGMVRY